MIVYLDFDGVIATTESYARALAEGRYDGKGFPAQADPPDVFDRECVARVNELCAYADAGIVVSSAWGMRWSLPQLQALLASVGLTAPVLGITPRKMSSWRYTEIRWDMVARRIGPTRVIIIEDAEPMHTLTPRTVRTQEETGFDAVALVAAKALCAPRENP